MTNYIQELIKTDSKIKKFSFDGIESLCKVVDVYDGDSIKVVFKYNDKMQKFIIRLFGIDTPEIRTKDIEEKKAGYEAKSKLSDMILNKIVFIKLGKFDKFGRILGTVYLVDENYNTNGICVNNTMIENGYGYEYYGGTKK